MRFLLSLLLSLACLCSFAASMSFDRTVYVATNGSDSASTLGTRSAPLLTITNALTRLNGFGTIIVRGGRYFNQTLNLTNVQELTVRAFPRERVEFWYADGSQNLTVETWSSVSNGIFRATLNAGQTAAIRFLTNYWDNNSPTGRGIYLYQSNAVYGTQGSNYFVPALTGRMEETNRCEHFPMRRATSVAAMTDMSQSNGCWVMQDVFLYVRFAATNVSGTIVIPNTNVTASFCYGAGPQTTLRVQGIRSYFGWSGFDFSGCGFWSFVGCYAFGSGRSGFLADEAASGSPTGDGELIHCRGVATENEGFEFTNVENSGVWPQVLQIGCVWTDYLREGSRVAFGGAETVIGSTAFGHNGQFGFISDGTHSTFIGTQTFSNTVAGTQLGLAQTLGKNSYQRAVEPRSMFDVVGFQMNDYRDIVIVQGGAFDNYGVAITPAENPTTHYVRQTGAIIAATVSGGNVNSAVIQGGGVPAANYVEDNAAFGSVAYVNGNSFLVAGGATPVFGMGLNMPTGYIAFPSTTVKSGTGSPEGAVTGTVGSFYFRTDGSGTTYTKTNGTGNTGWYDNLLRTHG